MTISNDIARGDNERRQESAEKALKAAGVADRCRVVDGDFFDSVPDGGDAYLLKSVVHDWDDDQATAILRNVRRAMPADGTLVVLEPVLPPQLKSPADVAEVAGVVMSDINMLVNTGGRERTAAELRALFAAAGFEVTTIAGPLTPSNYHAIAGTPA